MQAMIRGWIFGIVFSSMLIIGSFVLLVILANTADGAIAADIQVRDAVPAVSIQLQCSAFGDPGFHTSHWQRGMQSGHVDTLDALLPDSDPVHHQPALALLLN